MDAFLTVDQIIAKHSAGLTLTPWERSVHRLNVRPDGSRYSTNAKVRDEQYAADNAADPSQRPTRARR